MQVRFFAANALHQKISKGDVQELPADAQTQAEILKSQCPCPISTQI
jgi:hypothetical protein